MPALLRGGGAAICRLLLRGDGTPPPPPRIIRAPEDVAELLGREMAALEQEQLRVVLLDRASGLIRTHLVYQGTLDAIPIRLADVFREAIRANAAGLILCHNHTSAGPLSPSAEDRELTALAAAAGALLGVDIVDHLILGAGEPGFVSLRRLGYLPERTAGAAGGRGAGAARGPRARQAAQRRDAH